MPFARFIQAMYSYAFLFLTLITLTGCGSQDAGPELWVIGLDGADWDQLDPMIARGELPHLAALKAGGASGILLSDTPMISPILWTSIATGKTPDQHGVTWFMTEGSDGHMIPVSSEERKVRAFWNIASEAGISCGITGWWATWPAEPIRGSLVSDAVAWHSFGVSGRSNPDEGKTWPWDIVTRVEDLMPDPRTHGHDLMARLINKPADHLGYDPSSGPYENPINHLRQALATSRGFTDWTLASLQSERPRLMSVYYEGTDAVSHLFGRYQAPRMEWVDPEDYAAYRNVVDGYWRWQDQLLGELLAQRGPETTIMVISDHGFRQGHERRKEDHFHIETADCDHQPDGIVILNGPGIASGVRITDADIYDVTPTILHLLDLPVGQDMAGHPLTEAWDREILKGQPVDWIASHETGARDRASTLVASEAQGEDLEKMLRSLGYISGSETTPVGPQGVSVEQGVNLATVLMNQGRMEEAVRILEELGKENPDSFEIQLNLAQALIRQGRRTEGEERYTALLGKHPERLVIREDLGRSLQLAGDQVGALKVYEAGLAQDSLWVAGLAGKGACLTGLGRPDEARQALELARDLDPRNPRVHCNLGLLLRDQGDLKGAVSSLLKARRLEPADHRSAMVLAEIQSQRGDFGAAQETLADAMARGADRRRLIGVLGSIRLQAGENSEALRDLGEAHRLNPEDPEILGNLGMAQALGGSLDKAIASFEDLVRMAPDWADAHAQLGVMRMQTGQHEAGLQNLRTAVELAPHNRDFRLNLGYALKKVGLHEEAAEQFRMAQQ